MKNLFLLFLFYLVKKFIRVKIGDTVADYCVSEIQILKNWDGVETVMMTLKTLENYKCKI